MERTTYEIRPEAYLKMSLHARKDPFVPCNGVLLGKMEEKDGTRLVRVFDALPLFHGQLGLSPMTEVALAQVATFANQERGKYIVGCYHANDRIDDVEIGNEARRLADVVQRNASYACLLLLSYRNGEKMGEWKQEPELLCHVKERNRWKRANHEGSCPVEVKVEPPLSRGLLAEYMAEGRHLKLVDFDDHLDDPRKDWTNPEILA